MPFAVHLFFDPASERAIRSTWRTLAKDGVPSFLHDSATRPHLSLALYDELNMAACVGKLKLFAEMFSPFDLTISSLGIFPTGQSFVFLAPIVTQKLLDVHAYTHQLLEDSSTSTVTNYVPGCWIPHCTLVLNRDAGRLAQAIELSSAMPFPMRCRVEEIGVVECWPVKPLYSFGLGGG